MKLEKAIEILTHTLEVKSPLGKFPVDDAIQLGIEALKQIKHVQCGEIINSDVVLPGETPE